MRTLFLTAYAAIGPLLLWALHSVTRDRGFVSESLDDIVLFGAVASGAYCAYRVIPGRSIFKVGFTFVYALCMTLLVLWVALSIECARKLCL